MQAHPGFVGDRHPNLANRGRVPENVLRGGLAS